MTGEERPETPRTTAHPGAIGDDEISLWEVLAVLLRRRGVIVASTLVIGALAVTFALVRAPSFSTEASFQPQGSEASQSQLLALASQFGVNVGGGGGELSPAFYAELLTSREILLRVAEFDFQIDGAAVRLVDLLEVEDDTEELRLKRAIEWLRESALSVQTGRETGIVTVGVTTDWPELSLQIADRLLHEVSRFNLETRQSQAASERGVHRSARRQRPQGSAGGGERAAGVRPGEPAIPGLTRARVPVRALAAQRLAPTAGLQHARAVVRTARIAEVRDTPVRTVLQPPFMPPGPDERRLELFLVLGLVLGAMAGTVIAFVVEAFKRPGGGERRDVRPPRSARGDLSDRPFQGPMG